MTEQAPKAANSPDFVIVELNGDGEVNQVIGPFNLGNVDETRECAFEYVKQVLYPQWVEIEDKQAPKRYRDVAMQCSSYSCGVWVYEVAGELLISWEVKQVQLP